MHEQLKNKYVLIQQKTRYKVEGQGTYEYTTKSIVNPLSMRMLTTTDHVMDVGRMIAHETAAKERKEKKMLKEIYQAEERRRALEVE